MAAQSAFVSANAYYGYVQPLPTQQPTAATTTTIPQYNHHHYQPQQQQQQISGNQICRYNQVVADMEVEDSVQQQQQQLLQTQQQRQLRKRGCGAELRDEQQHLKRFRPGDFFWSEGNYGLAQMYHESSLLRLSPAADFDMACHHNHQYHQSTTMTGNLKLQSTTLSRNNNVRSQELEDMLLLTHGCSSYHHYRQSQLNQANDNEEAEF